MSHLIRNVSCQQQQSTVPVNVKVESGNVYFTIKARYTTWSQKKRKIKEIINFSLTNCTQIVFNIENKSNMAYSINNCVVLILYFMFLVKMNDFAKFHLFLSVFVPSPCCYCWYSYYVTIFYDCISFFQVKSPELQPPSLTRQWRRTTANLAGKMCCLSARTICHVTAKMVTKEL